MRPARRRLSKSCSELARMFTAEIALATHHYTVPALQRSPEPYSVPVQMSTAGVLGT